MSQRAVTPSLTTQSESGQSDLSSLVLFFSSPFKHHEDLSLVETQEEAVNTGLNRPFPWRSTVEFVESLESD